MPSGLRESLTHDDLTKLREAMDWVIPPDSSTGAGTDAGVARLLDLIDSQDPSVAAAYRQGMAKLGESDLADASNAFAALFVEQRPHRIHIDKDARCHPRKLVVHRLRLDLDKSHAPAQRIA